MSDAERLAGHVAVWWEAVDSFTQLPEKLPTHPWSTPTDLPGWDNHAVAAHTAHPEAVLADAEPTVGLDMDRETFLLLSSGWREAAPEAVDITGDATLAGRIIESMGVTP